MLKTRYEKNKDAQKNKTQNIYSQKTTKMNYSHYGGFKKNNRSRSSIKNTEGEKNLGLGGEKITKKRSRGFTIDRKTGKERSKGKEKINSNSPRKKFIKINNEIYSFNELKNYFREEKIDFDLEKERVKEKEKEENKSINEMYNMLNLSNSDILMKENEEDDDENTNSNGDRRNIKLLQNDTEEDMKDTIPDITPTYETKYINGFKFKLHKNQKK